MLVDIADEEIIIFIPLMMIQLAHYLFLLSLPHLLLLDLFQMLLEKVFPNLPIGYPCFTLFLDIDMNEVELSHRDPVSYLLKELS